MDTNNIMLAFLFGTIGIGYFVYGKKSVNYHFLIAGILLSVYPYFVKDIVLTFIIGVVIIVAPFLTNKYFN